MSSPLLYKNNEIFWMFPCFSFQYKNALDRLPEQADAKLMR